MLIALSPLSSLTLLSALSPLSSLTLLPNPFLGQASRTVVILAPPPSFLVLRNYPSLIPYPFAKPLSSERYRLKVYSLRPSIKAIRSYRNYSYLGRSYRVREGSNKYVDYIYLDEPCDLAPINLSKQRRLKNERKRLYAKLRKACVRVRKETSRYSRIKKLVESVEDK